MRKAVFVGINNYGHPSRNLRACINDASAMAAIMETHGDGSPNFDVRTYTDVSSKSSLTGIVYDLFKGDHELALFYFSGHGTKNEIDTYLVTPDFDKYSPGVSISELLKIINESRCRNKIVILDCCHAGATGAMNIIGSEASLLGNGVTILTASKPDEVSIEMNGHGIFSNLLLDAFQGGAADIIGNITPAAVYAYIDKALGAHDQRPVFKTNISEFITLRNTSPKVPDGLLRKLPDYFPTPDHQYPLDPSYEDSNSPDVKPLLKEPYAEQKNVIIFKELQKLQSAGLLIPVEAPFMYTAAMNNKSCRLTALGYHYWRLAKDKRI